MRGPETLKVRLPTVDSRNIGTGNWSWQSGVHADRADLLLGRVVQGTVALCRAEHCTSIDVDYFQGHSHCAKYRDQTSAHAWDIGQHYPGIPASYVVTSADLCSVTPGNSLCKYVDDTYPGGQCSQQSGGDWQCRGVVPPEQSST